MLEVTSSCFAPLISSTLLSFGGNLYTPGCFAIQKKTSLLCTPYRCPATQSTPIASMLSAIPELACRMRSLAQSHGHDVRPEVLTRRQVFITFSDAKSNAPPRVTDKAAAWKRVQRGFACLTRFYRPLCPRRMSFLSSDRSLQRDPETAQPPLNVARRWGLQFRFACSSQTICRVAAIEKRPSSASAREWTPKLCIWFRCITAIRPRKVPRIHYELVSAALPWSVSTDSEELSKKTSHRTSHVAMSMSFRLTSSMQRPSSQAYEVL
ncbi:uncharacterized protein BBA_09214 [Beauveria bassiana ARSEF 2860]|uniref:Uncharacterized protein n=1 Tax=Beauveria bassiana (strain ARSEF 2860) TaxID=655819 RepID=J4UGD1_BEAB2|nr:uncharacterized protein BBA_09214 [Beauveria bassiana ARSEF 2860]EJP61877.1 hypothetical protein BBA_09214 [Beauveria bassiana ARSEF 2860]